MIKILLFGTGSSAEKVLLNIRKDKAEITGCLDNDKKKQGSTYNGIKVYAPYELKKLEYDFIIIASVKYGLITEQLAGLGARKGSIIPYFKFDHSEYKKYKSFLYTDGMVYDELYKKYEDLDIYVHEMEYAVADKLNKGKIQLPDIMSIDDTIENIINGRLSVSRYGDGEFDLIFGYGLKFQKYSEPIGRMLAEVLKKPVKNHMVALADIYGDVSFLIDKYATFFRERLVRLRKKQYQLLDMERKYGNAFITRFYSEMKDKSDAKRRFQRIMQIWEDRDVVIVEGEFTRFGVGNNLLNKARSVRRILTLNENAFGYYKQIFANCIQEKKDSLFLLALGPAATILAYGLAKEGFQAVDIGHLDIEYEWFLRGVEDQKVVIEGKYTNEVAGGNSVTDQCNDGKYKSEIIKKII